MAIQLIFAFFFNPWQLDRSPPISSSFDRSPLPSSIVIPRECRSNASGDADIIIVGSGIAGSALAYALSKDERRIHAIERDLKEPNRIVGELLQPRGYLKLIELGLEDCLEKIDAQKVFGCFHNDRFIQRLREKVASLPRVQIEQGSVTSLLEENGIIKDVQYRKRKGEELRAYAPQNLLYLTNVYGVGRFFIPFPSPKHFMRRRIGKYRHIRTHKEVETDKIQG